MIAFAKIPNFIEPRRPIETAYVENFNARFRDECLNENWFTTLAEARQKIEYWRQDYNQARSALGYRTPNEFRIEAAAPATPPPRRQSQLRLCCPTRRDSHYDWHKNRGLISCYCGRAAVFVPQKQFHAQQSPSELNRSGLVSPESGCERWADFSTMTPGRTTTILLISTLQLRK